MNFNDNKNWIENLYRLFGSYKNILLDIGHDPLEIMFMSEDKAKEIVWNGR